MQDMTDQEVVVDDPTEQRLGQWREVSQSGTFEDAMVALELIIEILERGKLPLDTTIQCYEIGAALSDRCAILLENARVRVETIANRTLEDSRLEQVDDVE